MNIKQAKAEPLAEFLDRLGYQPAQVRGNDLWYRSPFRPEERTPSFKIDRVKNVWYDHGVGEGGTIIDFVQHLNQINDISQVLANIADIMGHKAASRIILPPVLEKPRDPPKIDSIEVISDSQLIAYLGTRAIPLDLARIYLKEITYQVDHHHFRALAFANDSGGFEIRNAAFKGSLGTKAMTYLPSNTSTHAAVFEGVFDFLSVLTHHKTDRPSGNILILNSVAMLSQGIEKLKSASVKKVFAYLDHDVAGENALLKLQNDGAFEVVDGAGFYLGFKDVNAYLQAIYKREGRTRNIGEDGFSR